jgi:predicted PurR-regulated permease PerM
MTWGPTVLEVLSGAGLVLVLSLYLLLDGRRVVAWLLAYVPRPHRRRMALMVPEVSAVVMAYTLGQLITSLLFAAFTFVLLTSLGVPAALPLALLAGACDVIPLVGILIATAPATILALTVSPATSLLVLGVYLGYHLLESYLLVPRLYGDRLQLSTLAVLIALIVGGTLYGIVGALLVLPLVAAYPVIERHWLSDYLGPEVLADHVALYEAHGGPHPDVVDAVLNGERHGATRSAPRVPPGAEGAG